MDVRVIYKFFKNVYVKIVIEIFIIVINKVNYVKEYDVLISGYVMKFVGGDFLILFMDL